jgi:cytochrome c556
MRLHAFGLRGLVMAGVLLAMPVALVAQDVIATRKANFTAIRDDVRWVNQNRANGSMEEITMRTGRIVENMGKVPGYFPAGSNTGDTKAKAEIWSDRATFEARAADALREARALQALAAAGNRAGLEGGLRTLGATCNACHDRFRAS